MDEDWKTGMFGANLAYVQQRTTIGWSNEVMIFMLFYEYDVWKSYLCVTY